jgi:glycosyltransferase involved in cell wall biosynthesis
MTADAVGGVWQYALDAAQSLRDHGVETTIAVLGPSLTSDQATEAGRAGVALVETGLPLDWTAETPEAVIEAGRQISALATAHAPDVVHLNGPALAAGTRFPAPVVGACHSCVATWWTAVKDGPLPEEFVWRMDLVRRGYAASARLTAPSSAFASTTARIYGLAEPPTVVPNGRRAPVVPSRGEPEACAFTAGRLWDEGKNLGTIDRAAARLSVPVEAAGPVEGPNRARVTFSHIRALGRLTDQAIAERLSRRPVYVSVAHYEPFGLAVLEAAQAGCALVLSDIASFRELWHGAAIFVPPDDDAALADAVEALIRDPAYRTRMAEAARVRAARYTPEATAAALIAVYRSLLVSKPVETFVA